MKFKIPYMLILIVITSLVSVTTLTTIAEARAGGGSRSLGSRGSRSYSRPASPSYQPGPTQPTQSPFQAQRPAGGGFLRSMAGGIAGGLLGGMLFRGLGFGGGAGGGGGGIGIFEILLIGGIIFMIYRFIKKKREQEVPYQNLSGPIEATPYQSYQQMSAANNAPQADTATGLNQIRQMDPSFDEQRFSDSVMDLFFKIQGAWMNRDLAPISSLLTTQMRQTFQADIDRMLAERKINRLENIAVRNVQIVEAWQEAGQDYITTQIYANLLDYTTDDSGTKVIEGSKTDPVKFEEYWTVTRPVGNNPWQLSAIDQK